MAGGRGSKVDGGEAGRRGQTPGTPGAGTSIGNPVPTGGSAWRWWMWGSPPGSAFPGAQELKAPPPRAGAGLGGGGRDCERRPRTGTV